MKSSTQPSFQRPERRHAVVRSMISNLKREFKTSLKSKYSEELPDRILFRPLAFVLVKLLIQFPITPNQISYSTFFIGLTAGLFFSLGDHRHFIVGGVIYALANIVDCADGMVARLKQCSTITGRIIDGVMDGFTTAAVYIGFAVGLSRAAAAGLLVFPFNPVFLAALAGGSVLVQSLIVDKYRSRFEAHVYGKRRSPELERQQLREEMNRLERHPIERYAIRWYLAISRRQKVGTDRPDHPAGSETLQAFPRTARVRVEPDRTGHPPDGFHRGGCPV